MVTALHDPDIEHAVVAEALRRYDRFTSYGLSVDFFEGPRYRRVLTALADAHEAGEGTSLDAVARVLQRGGYLEKPIGGTRGLADIAAGPATGAVPDPSRIKELWRLRTARDGALEAARLAGEGDLSAALGALAEAHQSAIGSLGGNMRTAGELGMSVLKSISDNARSGRVDLGLPALRKFIGYASVGSMTIVAADTNVGKSSAVLEMLLGAGSSHPAGLVSVEDPDEVTGARLLQAVCRVSARSLATSGKLNADDLRAINAGCVELDKLGNKFLYEDCMGGNELDVMAAMSRMAARGAKLVAVDYIQEIEPSKKQQDRRNEVRWISKRLKKHAKDCGQALILVSQLARPNDKMMGKRPNKHMIKESGDLTSQAENVILMWRTEEKDDAAVSFVLAKAKNGGVGAEWQMKRLQSHGGRLMEIEERDR